MSQSPPNTLPNPKCCEPGTARAPAGVLVCFAVKEEARPFQKLAEGRASLSVIVVGMGRLNADRAIREALAKERPRLVLTCGFAGGLNPELTAGAVVFSSDAEAKLDSTLQAAGARPVRFHCAERVAGTGAEKRALRESTGADAVEMESDAIRAVCREQGIPGATVRVILDTADEDLPLDFNQLMTPDMRLDGAKLALAIMKAPGKIGALRRLQQQGNLCAEKLAQVLEKITAV